MNYIIKNISNILIEGTHDLPNSRQTLIDNTELQSPNFQAFTKGILASGKVWDWHIHDDYNEIFTVLKGEGTIEFEDSVVHKYSEGDVILIKPKYKHKITATGETTSEFFFVRLK